MCEIEIHDFVLDGDEPREVDEIHGPYRVPVEGIKSAVQRWGSLGVALSRREGNDLCLEDGTPVAKIVYLP